MKITRIDAIPVRVPMRQGVVNSPAFDRDVPLASFADLVKHILRVRTDGGLEGIGETYRGVPEADIRRNIDLLVGKDPMALNLGALPIPKDRAYDGFEVALFDLVGKALSVPVWKLLGGRYRDRVLVDYWCGRQTPEDIARTARMAVERGFTGLKMKCALEDPMVERVRAIADAAGPAFRIIIDPNERFHHPAHAVRLARQLEGYNVELFEDPVPRWNLDWYALIRQKTTIPVALHIHLPYGHSPRDLIAAIRKEAIDYLNIGGNMADFVRLSATADLAGMPVWHGTEVDLGILDASYVHACAAAKNCTLGSDIIGNFLREDDLIVDPISFQDGHALVPDGPGLGVELDEKALERYRV